MTNKQILEKVKLAAIAILNEKYIAEQIMKYRDANNITIH